jgi:large subunit ribosomal protein L10
MSKAVKELMMRDYQTLLEGVEDALVVSIRGVAANDNNRMRTGLAASQIKITVIRNSLARKIFADTSLSGLDPILEGPSAIAYGAESVVDVARELVKWTKEVKNLELKGAVLDGQVFAGNKGVIELSKFPTREEAIAKAVTLVLSPGRNLMAQVAAPGSQLVGIIKAIEEKLENGETIAKSA